MYSQELRDNDQIGPLAKEVGKIRVRKRGIQKTDVWLYGMAGYTLCNGEWTTGSIYVISIWHTNKGTMLCLSNVPAPLYLL